MVKEKKFFSGGTPRKDLHYLHRGGFGVVWAWKPCLYMAKIADRPSKSEGE